MTADSLYRLVLRYGAHKAACIRREQIVLNDTFRAICEKNQCGMFGRCWVCPPESGDIHTLMDRVRSYDAGILYQTISPLEDSFDIEGMQDASRNHALLGQRIMAELGEEARLVLHLSCGGCHLCERCAKLEEKPCRFPGKPLLPLEVCGVDVYNTTSSTELKYINGPNTVTYFGLVLYREG